MEREAMTLEEYKQKVRECLMKIHNRTIQGADKLMTMYEDDLQEFFNENWEVNVAALAMTMGY